jgi:ATP/maltotriose-dependent transcriptional regulator MalT
LKVLEYRYFIRELSLEVYLAIIAICCTALGAWVGLRLTARKRNASIDIQDFEVSVDSLNKTGISKREFEVLNLIYQGNSNQEIADKLFVSVNTVKTHTSNLFIKLDAKRRTQAIQRAKILRLIP